ncbi:MULTISPECIES: TonB-dependent receptor [unclassified Sphingomonas]|uniref:TonB-dependent receptor n=1 Tax=Novosphingobium rhizosphaerae TaxID=1551649 RepID=UPI0015CB1947
MRSRSHLFRGSAGLGALTMVLLSSAAAAQDYVAPLPANPAVSPDASDGAIVVTGTRIKRADLQSNSPLSVVSAQELQYQGNTNVEDALNRMPQFTADANDNVSNGSDGTAQINLRNLGANRVLTLLNGQRMLPGQAMDINFVPSALIERIDVVTGGASAVYGSDAISGVVNFILRDKLEGLRVDAQGSINNHHNNNAYVRGLQSARGYETAPNWVTDGGKVDVNGAFGHSFAGGRGHVTVYGGYRKTNPVLQSSRDYSACALNQADDVGTGLACGGSSNTTYGTFVPLTGPSAGSGYITNAKDGSKTWVPYDSSYAYNYTPTNYIQRQDTRYTGGGFLSFDVSDAAKLTGSFMYMDDQTHSQVAPSALFLGTSFNINCDNPLMSASQATALCGAAAGTSQTESTLIGYRLNNDFSRRDDLRHKDYRYNLGVQGDLGHGFSYNVDYMFALVRYNETYSNNVDNVKAQRALNVVNVNGTPTCQSVIDGTDPDCVPIDVFQANGITSAQAKYLFSNSNTASRNSLRQVTAGLNGDLGTFGIKTPWAKNGVAIALGVENRKETLLFTADAVAKQGGTTDADGEISVWEGYGEVEVPILEDVPFAHRLTLNGGLRYSSYTNDQLSSGNHSAYRVWTYKGELAWAPDTTVRLRTSYNRAIRAPNITELFGSQSVGNVSLSDPCAGTDPTASATACAATGVTAAQYGTGAVIQCPADTCSQLSGGNPALKPEKADTITVGLVLTPADLRNFSVSVDYYHIKVKDYISTIDPSLIVSQCVSTGDPYYCGLFHRDPQSGAIFGTNGYIVSTTLNTGSLKTDGIDLNIDYMSDLGRIGRLSFNFAGTFLLSQVNEPLPGLGTYDCKGYFGYTCGQPNPEWRHNARLTWSAPREVATVSLAWRHIGGTRLSSTSSNSFLTGTGSLINGRIKSYDYIDLAMTGRINRAINVRAGVNNLFDRDPPAIASGILSSFGNGNTYPGVYSALGRNLFVGATLAF